MDPTSIAFLFPGQGSQAVGMGFDLAQRYPSAKQVFEEANDLLGFHLSHLAWEGPEEELNDTINTQPALFIHSVAALRVLQEIHPEIKPDYVAGHSMGELTALVSSGALSFADALHLVRIRGELMKRAGEISPGGMAAIIGLDIPALESICVQVSTEDAPVQVANDNCPGQVVISGANAPLDRAISMAQEIGARRAIRLAVSIAAHSPLMLNSQSDFNLAVNNAPIKNPHTPLVGNVSATPLVTADEIRSDLQNQLTHRVRWTGTIQYMIAQGITTFIEIGSGSVLIGLLKRIDKQANGIALGTPADFSKLGIHKLIYCLRYN
jgi:[acyl-carrier-protein] S-malonyltransferase